MSLCSEKRPTVKVRTQGVVLYCGPSLLDGSRIVVIATGLMSKSKNPKTGKMVPVYILADNGSDPVQAAKNGGDAAVCGNCPMRPDPETGKLGPCYVNLIFGPLAIYRGYHTGKYPRFNARRHGHLFAGRHVRFGAYGDPAAVPMRVWDVLASLCDGYTGYTHQWQTCDAGLRRYCMASVQTAGEYERARAAGWRTFRVRTADMPVLPGEFLCPASAEAGKKKTCQQCKACSGVKAGGKNANPVIVFHGSETGGNWKLKSFNRVIDRLHTEERRTLKPLPTVQP